MTPVVGLATTMAGADSPLTVSWLPENIQRTIPKLGSRSLFFPARFGFFFFFFRSFLFFLITYLSCTVALHLLVIINSFPKSGISSDNLSMQRRVHGWVAQFLRIFRVLRPLRSVSALPGQVDVTLGVWVGGNWVSGWGVRE